MPPTPQASWHNPRILLTLLLVFLCGSLAGALAMRYGVHPRMHQPPPRWTEGGKEISLLRFKKELDLTPEQAERIETILDDFVMYYDTLGAQMDEVRANGKNRILNALDLDQKKRFEAMLGGLQ
jgi:Spy/CpxP family protein refolding chaperone